MSNKNEMSENFIKELRAQIAKKINDFEQVKVRIAIIGRRGQGKSSLINAIAGKIIAKTSPVEETQVCEPYEKGGLIFVDCPGCGTTKFQTSQYIDQLNLLKNDIFIFLNTGGIMDDDIVVLNDLRKRGKTAIFLVRSKFDDDVRNAKYDGIENIKGLKEKIRKDASEKLNEQNVKLYFISTRENTYDFPQLMDDITNSLSEVKQDNFIREVKAWGISSMKKKESVAEKLIGYYAALAILNGINPIPVLDVSVDIGILIALANHLKNLWGIDEESIQYCDPLNAAKFKIMAAQILKNYITEEGVIIVLKRIAPSMAVKSIAKWIPIVGQIFAATLGYKLTISFGEEINIQFKELAYKFFETLINREVVKNY